MTLLKANNKLSLAWSRNKLLIHPRHSRRILVILSIVLLLLWLVAIGIVLLLKLMPEVTMIAFSQVQLGLV
jgi:hypothetical protein